MTNPWKRKQEDSKIVRIYPFLWKTIIVVIHFAHASPWLSTIPITNYIQLYIFQYILGNNYRLLDTYNYN